MELILIEVQVIALAKEILMKLLHMLNTLKQNMDEKSQICNNLL